MCRTCTDWWQFKEKLWIMHKKCASIRGMVSWVWKWCESYAEVLAATRYQPNWTPVRDFGSSQSSSKYDIREYYLEESVFFTNTLYFEISFFVTHLNMHIKHIRKWSQINQLGLLAPEKIEQHKNKLLKSGHDNVIGSFKGPLSEINWKQSTSEPAHWSGLANNRPWATSWHTCWQPRESEARKRGEREKSLIKLFEFDLQ